MINAHFWGGEEMPAHIKNIRDWTHQVDDNLLYSMRKLVEEVYRKTYGERYTLLEDREEVINIVARKTLDNLYDNSREFGIEIWCPTADNYGF